MIGNDIVDLKLASVQSDWKRKGFLDKLFSKRERRFIFDSSDSSMAVWRLWSIKESAYKIHVRKTKVRRFNPKQFSCEDITETEGIVIRGHHTYKTTTFLNDDFIHTIATECDYDQEIFNGMIIKQDQHNLASILHKKFLKDLAARQFLALNDLQILKNEFQAPELFLKGIKLNLSCSLSHHGGHAAYVSTI